MEQTFELDNQQATSRVAGLYLGEGHFVLSKKPRQNGRWNIDAEIGFSNTDPDLVDLVCAFLDDRGVAHHVSMNNADCYQIRVMRHPEVKKLLEMLMPYLYGRKLAEARIVYRFVIKAVAKMQKPVPSIPGSGKYAGFQRRNANLQFDEQDVALADEKQALKESSETIRVPQCVEKHGFPGVRKYCEDIVQSRSEKTGIN